MFPVSNPRIENVGHPGMMGKINHLWYYSRNKKHLWMPKTSEFYDIRDVVVYAFGTPEKEQKLPVRSHVFLQIKAEAAWKCKP